MAHPFKAQIELCDATAKVHRDLLRRGMFRSCLNCDFSDPKSSICKLYNTVPPKEIIVFGCEKWDEVIPF